MSQVGVLGPTTTWTHICPRHEDLPSVASAVTAPKLPPPDTPPARQPPICSHAAIRHLGVTYMDAAGVPPSEMDFLRSLGHPRGPAGPAAGSSFLVAGRLVRCCPWPRRLLRARGCVPWGPVFVWRWPCLLLSSATSQLDCLLLLLSSEHSLQIPGVSPWLTCGLQTFPPSLQLAFHEFWLIALT